MGRKKKAIISRPKFFPFSPGIPWFVSNNCIIPKIDYEIWHRVLDNKNIFITAFGGLIESFCSLCVAEAIAAIDTKHKIYWLGNSEFSYFSNVQGLCSPTNIKLTKEKVSKYPVPLFFDKNNNAYFNVLYNYLIQYSWNGKNPKELNIPIIEQIYRNSMIPWNNYTPKLRKLNSEFYDELIKTGKIKQRSKIITIILNKANENVLGWNLNNIKEFAQLAYNKRIKVIVFTKNVNLFYGTNILALEYDFRKILQVLLNSWIVLSTDIDWLLITLLISKAKIISKPLSGPYDLLKNAEFIGSESDIFTDRTLSTIDVFRICESL